MLVALALILVVAGAGAIYLGLSEGRVATTEPADAESYLRSLDIDEGPVDEFERVLEEPFLNRIIRPLGSSALALLGGVLPRNYRQRIQTRLLYAGLAGQLRAEEIISLQVLGTVVGVILAVLVAVSGVVSGGVGILTIVALPIMGSQVAKVWLERKVAERTEAIRRDLPDTLDLLAISVEAGMGFEGALGVVCDNFDSPLADEFARTLREMELGLPRKEALQNLKRRTEVPELSNFVLTLTQADALGMPIGRVLKTAADEMRTRRQQWAREKAGKLPVKILFPLVLFIFPPIFIVLMGPAASEIGSAFGG